MNQKLKGWVGRLFTAVLIAMFVYAFAYTLPFDFALLAAIDMATYVDALIGVYLIARITRLRPVLAYARLRAAIMVRRLGTRTKRLAQRPAKRDSAANDDHPEWALAA